MKNHFTLAGMHRIYLLVFGLILLTSCKNSEIASPAPASGEETPVVPSKGAEAPSGAIYYDLGTGSGDLTIDGSTMKLAENAFIRIKSGAYQSITIKNILATAEKPVLIKNDGQVTISSVMNTQNVANIIISGDNAAGITYGFKFQNIAYRAIVMTGKMSGVTLRNMSFTNVKDYTISGDKTNGAGLTYNNTESTRTDNFKILNCLFENAGTIIFGGTLNKGTGEDNGLYKGVEIAYNIFQNSPQVGSLCTFSNVQDYDIHNNVVNNINQNTNDHNGVFLMQGNGKFHDNKLTNYQGNAIRMWLYSRGSSPATNEIYNNICYNTRKYSAFELQSFDRNMYSGKSTYANAKVYNNTAGKMNTTKDWEGQILDLYNTGGSLEYYNNLGFDLYTDKAAITDMINNMSDTKITSKTNNIYTTQQEAVNNTTALISKISNTGATGI